MIQPPRLHLFQAYGVELEYMIVDKSSLSVRPISDEVLKEVTGAYQSDFDNGMVTWSNELVLHVIELKSTKPEDNLSALNHAFADNVRKINGILSSFNAMLMPGAAHPLMVPAKETKLWPHDNNEVYDIYNRIFDCKGHGWSNLQSTHLNLPFYDDEEFAKLHAAVRMILPLLPALCASSPILDGQSTGTLDSRMKFYKSNQEKIPCITGKVVPEAVFSKRNYVNLIYEKIKTEIAPFNHDNILDPVWVNSRGAIPRFDRGSIEIRIMDIQECPAADLAIVTLVVETLKHLVHERFLPMDAQLKWKTEPLAQILDEVVNKAGDTAITHQEYLRAFNISQPKLSAAEVWYAIINQIELSGNQILRPYRKELDVILSQGTLSKRIMKAVGNSSEMNIIPVYRQLSDCLNQNRMFIP